MMSVVFVGSVSFDATEEDMRQLFAECGDVVEVRLPRFRDSGRSRGIAFVEFATNEACLKAMELDGCEHMGRRLAVRESYGPPKEKRHSKSGESASESTVVYVGNLSYETTESDLRDAFEQAGEIKEVRIAWNHRKNRGKGFAHVEFANSASVENAMKLHGTDVNGRAVRIDHANALRN